MVNVDIYNESVGGSVRATYCDLCGKNIIGKEKVYTMKITRGEFVTRRFPDVCENCYQKIDMVFEELSNTKK